MENKSVAVVAPLVCPQCFMFNTKKQFQTIYFTLFRCVSCGFVWSNSHNMKLPPNSRLALNYNNEIIFQS